jgi:ariadne-1
MEEIQAHSNLSWIEVQFMKRAVDTLSACRATLKWTYAMAYYLKKDNATIIFEDNQNDLEQKVEDLSELIEKPLEEDTIEDLRYDVTNRTVRADGLGWADYCLTDLD